MNYDLKKTLLLVEDESLIAIAGKRSLEKYGYAVIVANSGEKAVDICFHTDSIDLILMDIDLGKGIDGTEAAVRILAERNIPVVFLSSHTEPDIVEKTEKITSYGYVVKNTCMTVLDASIKMAFKLFEANKRTEEEKNHLRITLNSIGDAVIATDNSGLVTRMNPVAENLTGWKISDAIGKSIYDIFKIVNAHTREPVENPIQKVLETGMTVGLANHTVLISKDGNEYQIADSGAPIKDAIGLTDGVVLVFRDVSEDYRVKSALLDAKWKFKALFEKGPIGVAYHRMVYGNSGKPIDFSFLDVNERFIELTGVDPRGKLVTEAFPGIEKNEFDWISKFADVVRTGNEIRVEEYLPQNDRWYDVVAYQFMPDHFVAAFLDITKRKKAEAELENFRLLLKSSIESPKDMLILSIDKNYQYLYFNTLHKNVMKETYGVDVELGMNALECISNDEDRKKAQQNYDRALAGENHITVEEYGDFERYYFETRYSAIMSDTGEIVGATAFSSDVTVRMKAVQAQKAMELKYRSLIEFSGDVVFCVDCNGEYQFTNKIFAEAFGMKPNDLVGKTFWDLYPKVNADIRQAANIVLFETGESQTMEIQVPLPNRTPMWFLAKTNAIRDESGKVVLNLTHSTDITERKLAEEKVKKLLEDKTIMLKEVHHRIKNNMMSVKGLLEFHARSLKDSLAVAALEDAGSRVQSMMVLYDKLYQSANFNELSVSVYLPSLVDEIIANFSNGQSVRIEKEIDDIIMDSKTLQALGIIINELLTNIMKYAFVGRNDCWIMVSAKLKGSFVSVAVADNGVGLPSTLDFEKTGSFGLMLVDGLVKQLNGTLRIEREGGTKIIFEFML